METMQPTPREIRAKIGRKVLSKAPELFPQDLPTILSELLQNARRASATRVDITTTVREDTRCEIIITDNGAGISDPQILLTFGESDWDEHTDVTENAAGMGFYSLASTGCTIASADWVCTIDRDGFVGTVPVAVQQRPWAAGTTITFLTKPGTSPESVAGSVKEAVLYFPVPTYVNGERAQQRDFLEGALFITERMGLRFGVFAGHTLHSKYDNLNFFGRRVQTAAIATVTESVPRRHEHPTRSYYLGGYKEVFHVYVDVVDAPELQLVLPHRHQVIRNAFWESVQSEAKRVIYEYLATDPRQQLSHADAMRARELGISMPDPDFWPFLWTATSADDERLSPASTSPDGDQRVQLPNPALKLLRLESGLDTVDEINLHTALTTDAQTPYTLIEDDYAGYPSFEAIPKVDTISYRVRVGQREFTLPACNDYHEAVDAMWGALDTNEMCIRADSIDIILHAKNGTEVSIPSPCAILRGNDIWWDDDLRIAATAAATPQLLQELLMLALFSTSDSHDADSAETQHDAASTHARQLAVDCLGNKYEAAIASVEDSVSNIRWTIPKSLRSITINLDDAKHSSVVYTFADGTAITK